MRYIVEGINLKKYYPINQGLIRRRTLIAKAVDGVSIGVEPGQTLALVGESGSGKTTVGKMLLSLIEPTEGEVLYKGTNVAQMSSEARMELKSKAQIIFQDPDASLNPRHRVGQILSLPFMIHRKKMEKRERRERILELLEKVGLNPATQFVSRYPHQLSGGQKQRVDIARAIALEPEFIVADEPVSSLDVSVRAQILRLMKKLQEEMNISYLFITHDLAVVRSIAHSVSTMYLGRVVESCGVDDEFESAMHPYTQSLLLSTPVPRPSAMQARVAPPVMGEVPSSINPPSGCTFHPRCKYMKQECVEKEPMLMELRPEHYVACHLAARGEVKPMNVASALSVTPENLESRSASSRTDVSG